MPDLRERLIEALNMAFEPLPIEDPHPALVKAQRHDGHGFMGACFVCQGDVAKLADVMLGVVGSWAGLVSLLDEHWPADVFTGASGDPGPAIVFLMREVDRLRREVEFWAKAEPWSNSTEGALRHRTADGSDPNGVVVCECGHPCQSPEDWVAHGDAMTPCVCVTDEQAAQLGPRFSRPVCAVHPEGGGSNG